MNGRGSALPFLFVLHTALLHIRIGWTEDACGAVLPDPGVNHPLRFGRKVAATCLTLAVIQITLDAAIGEDTKVRMPVPVGQ